MRISVLFLTTGLAGTALAGPPVEIDSGSNVGHLASAAVVDGRAAVAYRHGGDQSLKYARCRDAGCTEVTVNTVDADGNAGWMVSLAVADGLPVILYQAMGDRSTRVARCQDVDCNEVSMAAVEWATNASTLELTAAMEMPVMLMEPGSSGKLNLVRCADMTCATGGAQLIPTKAGVGQSADIAMVDGLPSIVYRSNSRDGEELVYVRCTDLDCSASESRVLASGDDVGFDVDMTLVNGLPAITYYQAADDQLHLLTCGDATCEDIADHAIGRGGATVGGASIGAVGGVPVLAYIDSRPQTFHYAVCADARCSNASVSRIGNESQVGWFPAMVVIDDQPIVFYQDSFNDKLLVRALGD